jgi:hypothetical protein
MRRIASAIAIAATVGSGCRSQAPTPISGRCATFPPAPADQKGGAFGSTTMGAGVRHSPPRRHADIPAGPLEGVVVVLERTGCYGTCPSYRIEVHGDGRVVFHGNGYVNFQGDHEARIPPLAVQCLLDDFRTADFWSLDPEYKADVTDLPTYTVSLTVGRKTKTLTDYAGQAVGMPAAVSALEQAIDAAAGSDTWITGNAGTIAALQAEHFEFRSRRGAEALANAAQDAPDAVVFALLDRGAPPDGLTTNGVDDTNRISAVEAAASHGRVAVVRRLIGAGAFAAGGRDLVSATLRASVASQSAAMVAEILKHRPDVNSPDRRGDTALALIFTGAHPLYGEKGARDEDAAIIRLLGRAGADPKLPNSEHRPLLELASSQEDKQALLSIGASRRAGGAR